MAYFDEGDDEVDLGEKRRALLLEPKDFLLAIAEGFEIFELSGAGDVLFFILTLLCLGLLR